MEMSSGWTITQDVGGTFCLVASSGFFVGGFASEVAAGVWLSAYLLGCRREDQRREDRVERARLRILAQMEVRGRVY
jgi:hypothetical protein